MSDMNDNLPKMHPQYACFRFCQYAPLQSMLVSTPFPTACSSWSCAARHLISALATFRPLTSKEYRTGGGNESSAVLGFFSCHAAATE